MTSLTLVRQIKARPAIVFEALTTPEGIARWWGPDAGPVLFAETDVRIGGRFRVRFRMLDGTEHESTGEYLEVEESKRLVMSWQWTTGGEPDEAGNLSRLSFDLEPIDSGTELTLTHARLKTEASRVSHEQGWTGAIEKLAHRFSDASAEDHHDQT
ncbi:MAG TPA: SRPBCC domain-containing protein [Candidatus Binataceae bacterium]|nr:SRPBCC domain-containing protein [Candidatus Binataceae bacterium]